VIRLIIAAILDWFLAKFSETIEGVRVRAGKEAENHKVTEGLQSAKTEQEVADAAKKVSSNF